MSRACPTSGCQAIKRIDRTDVSVFFSLLYLTVLLAEKDAEKIRLVTRKPFLRQWFEEWLNFS